MLGRRLGLCSFKVRVEVAGKKINSVHTHSVVHACFRLVALQYSQRIRQDARDAGLRHAPPAYVLVRKGRKGKTRPPNRFPLPRVWRGLTSTIVTLFFWTIGTPMVRVCVVRHNSKCNGYTIVERLVRHVDAQISPIQGIIQLVLVKSCRIVATEHLYTNRPVEMA